MILLIPLGPEAGTGRLPRATIALVCACVVVFLATHREETRKVELEAARLERLASWEIQKLRAARPDLAAARDDFPTAFAFLAARDDWPTLIEEPEAEERLRSYLEDHERVRASDPLFRYGFIPAGGGAFRVLSHQFLHVDILHLLLNMIFLWAVGGLLEAAWGAALFVPFYLSSGVAAAIAHAVAHPRSIEPAIGASGAVAGLMGAFATCFGRERIRVAFVAMAALAPRIQILTVPAWILLSLWLAEQLFFVLLTARMQVGIAFEAHVGGFVFGAVAALPVMKLAARAAPPEL